MGAEGAVLFAERSSVDDSMLPTTYARTIAATKVRELSGGAAVVFIGKSAIHGDMAKVSPCIGTWPCSLQFNHPAAIVGLDLTSHSLWRRALGTLSSEKKVSGVSRNPANALIRASFNQQSMPEPGHVTPARGSQGECKAMSNVIKGPTSAAAGRAATKKQLPDRFKAYKHVWVFVEQERGKVHPVSWELMGAGRKLADRLKVKLAAVVVGPEGEATRNAALEAFCYGADLTYLVADNVLSDYRNESYTKALSDLVEIYKPEILLLGATTLGRDLAGSVATRLQTGLTADCTELDVDTDGSLAATRPTFGGSLLCTIYTLNYRPQMATVRPRVMPMPERVARDPGRIIVHPLGLVEDDIVTKVLSFIPDRDSTKSNLAYADVVVAGGVGLGSQENFQLVRQLAGVLGAEYGCSRPLVQKGWVTSDRQIGQTGKTIRPKLYIAAGVSGAIQHRVGVEGADLIVAINTDKNAPIFDFAHIAIVSDAMHLLPVLTDAFRARLSPHSRDRIAS